MAKISVDLGEDAPSPESKKLASIAAPLPSVSKAKAQSMKSAPRVQFAFTNVPQPIKEAFVAEAKRRKITQKALLYECLRAGGLDIPDADEIDGRTR
ncbi:MAG: hypothetical protein AAFN09_17300 [Pseudomonadota bacterium]